MLFRSAESLAVNVISNYISDCAIFSSQIVACEVACVASLSVRFRSKERGTRVKDRAKTAQVKERRGGGQNRSFFAPKPNGNACYVGYL